MGAWGTGPFDSDGALDFLDFLAAEHARSDDDGDVIPESVDRPAAAAAISGALVAVTRPDRGHPAEYRPQTIDEAYASAGLVAAALNPPQPPTAGDRPSGTRLFANLAHDPATDSPDGLGDPGDARDPLGLLHDCGYGALLDVAHALQLREQALAAVAAIGGETEWVGTWADRTALLAQLERLSATLSATPAGAV